MAETEEEERDAERKANHVTMDANSNIYMSWPTLDSTPIGFKNHYTISPSQGESVHSTISPSRDSTISLSQGKIASVTSERRISSINGFNSLTI